MLLTNAYMIVIIILVINIVYVSFSTIRMILTLKGRRYLAALVSMVEVVVYILGLSIVLDNLNGIQNIVAYAVGFALGIIIGSAIEERLALGYITVNVVSGNPELNFSECLRKKGYGVTSWTSSGMDGERISIQFLTQRKQEVKLYELISEIDPRAFIVSYEPKHIQGGYWMKQVRRGSIRKAPPEILSDIAPTEPIIEEDAIIEEVDEETVEERGTDTHLTKPRPQKPNIKTKL